MKTSCACSLVLLGLLLAPVAFGASTGLEVDPPSDTGAACPTPRATFQQHLKVTAWELRDQTDGVGELVQKRAWLLLPGTGGFDLTGKIKAKMDGDAANVFRTYTKKEVRVVGRVKGNKADERTDVVPDND